jgi:hypothetical protein
VKGKKKRRKMWLAESISQAPHDYYSSPGSAQAKKKKREKKTRPAHFRRPRLSLSEKKEGREK